MELALIPCLLIQCTVEVFYLPKCTKSKRSILPESVRIVDLLSVIAVEKTFSGVFLPKCYAVAVPNKSGVCT